MPVITGIITDMVLVNSGFPHMKEFPEHYLHFGYASTETFASPVLGQKKFKEYWFEGMPSLAWLGHQTKNLPRASACLRSTLVDIQ
jgi:hypothetical protein